MAWETILRIRQEVKENVALRESLLIACNDFMHKHGSPVRDAVTIQVRFSKSAEFNPHSNITISATSPFSVQIDYNIPVPLPQKHLFELYAPYALLPYFALKFRKTFVITHFAQSLDGRIASVKGDSKWIGNQSNLVHAHRMRALVDGILIGAGTLKSDDPKLTVRHVTGEDPIRILVGGRDIDLASYNIGKKDHISYLPGKAKEPSGLKNKRDPESLLNTDAILEDLFTRGILSVFIEGGSFTTSTFLGQENVDQIQIHLAPVILGSGKVGFSFQGIHYLDEAIYFSSFKFLPVGDEIMFIGEL